jgi:DNA polymerase V
MRRRKACNCPWQPPTPASSSGAAVAALGAVYRPGYRYKKAGVMLLDLTPAAEVQAGLFDAPDYPKSVAGMKAVDGLNARFGRGTVGFGTAGRRQAWGLRREFISPRFTTVWDELLRV